LRNVWAGLLPDVQERWGDDFFKMLIEQVMTNVFNQKAEDPNKVVRAVQHAIVNTVPCIRYRPGWQSSLFFYPLSLAPVWLVDHLMAGKSTSQCVPAGVRKQLKD
jgi:hypothetical protein